MKRIVFAQVSFAGGLVRDVLADGEMRMCDFMDRLERFGRKPRVRHLRDARDGDANSGAVMLEALPVRRRPDPAAGLSPTQLSALRIVSETDGAEVPENDWPIHEELAGLGLIEFGAARGPGRAWRRAELTTAGHAAVHATEAAHG